MNAFEGNPDSQEQILDTLTLYLRQIHGYCFYSGIKSEDERSLSAKCGPQHLRTKPSTTLTRSDFESSPLYATARKFEKDYVSAAEKTIERGPQEKIQDPQEDEILVEMKKIYCINKTKEVQEG